MAEGGTLFLDEIGDLSPLIQLKLLRVLQEREFERVGESIPRPLNVRIVCATHRDLRELVNEGKFREDLYYRIRVFPISLPPLRSRRADIPLLIDAFIQFFNEKTGKKIAGVSEDVFHCLMDHCWPGNVRELENAIEHAFVTCPGTEIGLLDLPIEIRKLELRRAHCQKRQNTADKTEGAEFHGGGPVRREELLAVLRSFKWNRSEAARRLKVDRTTVWRWMKRWRIAPPNRT